MKARSRFFFWSSLLLLIIGTFISWQLRYIETDSVYWRDRPLKELTNWRRHEGSLAPTIITTETKKDVLEFSPRKSHQAISINSWQVTGTEEIKIRLRHRSVDPIERYPDQKTNPISIAVAGIDENHHLILDRVGHFASGNISDSWKVSEAVMPLSEKARKFSFSIVVTGKGGSLQISDLDIVEVREAPWFSTIAVILWTLWALWIYRAINRHQSRLLISLITTLWLLAWSGYLIFPRTIDIPRPFSSEFWISANASALKIEPLVSKTTGSQKNLQKVGPTPKEKRLHTDKARRWFKSFGGGRFLMHFGIMGVFAGGLLLLLPLRNAWPYILTMMVGIELVPTIMINNADTQDLFDLLAYLLAVIIAIPVAARIKRFNFVRRILLVKFNSSGKKD